MHPFLHRLRARVTLAGCLLVTPLAAMAAPPRVFACEPEWAALVRTLVPSALVDVATSVHQDPHHIEARPALIAQLRRADLAVCTGSGLEEGWLPVLQERAGNARVHDGTPGMFYAAEAVTRIDPRPQSLNPFAGDVHPAGNPHVHTDPERLLQIAQALSRRLIALWPEEAEAIRGRELGFRTRWLEKLSAWRQAAAPLRGRTVAAQHATFGYLWQWLGVRQTLDLEPRPGLPPTPGHLQSLTQRWAAEPVFAIVVALHQDARPARWLAAQAQPARRVLVLPATVPDPLAPDALERWWEGLLNALLAGVEDRTDRHSTSGRPG